MYYVVYGLLWLLSRLPLRVLYVISDGVYGLVYYVFGYRKKVVMQNLLTAFPEKSEAERLTIAKKFYRNFTDTMVETIKMFSASTKLIHRRSKANWEIAADVLNTGRNVQLHIGHNFNWEWANAIASDKVHLPRLVIYMPLGNKIFDRIFYQLRSKFGTTMIRATHLHEDLSPFRKKQHALGFIADQNPGNPRNAWWFNFFGRPTPFLRGPAKSAIINNAPVVFAYVHKEKRGYYVGEISIATMEPKTLSEQELTRMFVRYLEDKIRQYPEMWLWSHRRWKHEWKPEYGPVLE